MSRKRTICLAFSGCALLAALAPAAAPAASPSVAAFQPHRATYELLLVPGRGDGSVRGGGGRLDFEWTDACDGWAVSQRTRVLLEQEQGGELDFGWSLSTWEAKDGRAFDFTIQRYQNGSVYETVQGDAVLGPDGAGSAAYAEPVARTVDLPPGTMFPTNHTFAMLEAARNGALPVYSTVFDASSEHDGLTAVSTVLGARVAPDAPASLDVPLLRNTRSWRLLLAYFPPTGPAELPDTEVALRLFANGIAEDFVFDYGDFALRARLTDLTALPDPDC